ncbi:hypothetical protein H5410_023200 [Solanum commersonii]|uniref:Uncharacterized protein n=1 Tax=Solanum commersonii TaxID=4109 RepID=A0A9J5ZIM1_SOLCO|nr:hypothetical protein H5410_023200 [Solanum commersonii]
MVRQIAVSLSSLQSAKARCSLSPSTALASELQAINIGSRRGEQQHLWPTTTNARASSDELPAKQQRTSNNDNNEPVISLHLHSSHLRRNSSFKDGSQQIRPTQHLKKLIQDYIASFIKVGDKVGASKFLKFDLEGIRSSRQAEALDSVQIVAMSAQITKLTAALADS